MNDDTKPACDYILHDDGIHEFIVRESSTEAADAYLAGLGRIYQLRSDTREPIRVLLDSGGHTLPLQYTFQRGRELSTKYPNMGTTKTATLTDSAVEARLVDSFMHLMRFPGVRIRFFSEDRRDEAIAWLLGDD